MADVSPKEPEVPPKFLYRKPSKSSWTMANGTDTNEYTLKQHAKEFTQVTTLHGFQFIGEDGRNWFERYYSIWLTFLNVCFCIGCQMSREHREFNAAKFIIFFLVATNNLYESSKCLNIKIFC